MQAIRNAIESGGGESCDSLDVRDKKIVDLSKKIRQLKLNLDKVFLWMIFSF